MGIGAIFATTKGNKSVNCQRNIDLFLMIGVIKIGYTKKPVSHLAGKSDKEDLL
jgi:hypothetical protein